MQIKVQEVNSKEPNNQEILLKQFVHPLLKKNPISDMPKSLLPFNKEVLSKEKKERVFQIKLYEFYKQK